MTRFPFSVTIRAASANSPPQTITCVGLLRGLGRKRQVLEATWDGRAVIAKIFGDPIKARYHALREWRGLKHLQERGVNSPAPLFQGKSERYGWVVVTEKISDAANVRQVWDETTDPARRRELLCRVSEELARCHNKGVLQKDLHLANFMIQGDKIFALDPSQMRFLSGQVGPRRSIAQLALLASFAPDEDEDTISMMCEEYARVRLWKFSESDMKLFRKELTRWKKKGINRGVRKSLRTSKRHQRFNTYSHRGVAIRKFFEKLDFGELAANIDKAMHDGHVLKNGNTCFVAHIGLAGKEVVVKRYNHRGIIHSLRHTIKGSRARHSWLHANRLTLLGIATPRPLAYIDQLRASLVWKSYLVTEYVEGQKLYDFLRDGKTGQEQRSMAFQQVKKLLDKLGKYRITHGDLKHTNILITENGPVLTDLDAMRAHKWSWIHGLRQSKDLERFINKGNGGQRS